MLFMDCSEFYLALLSLAASRENAVSLPQCCNRTLVKTISEESRKIYRSRL